MTFEDEAKIMKHHLCLPLIAPCNLCALHEGIVELRGEVQELKAYKIAALKELHQLKYDLELAVAHDRQPYPTAEAYELACKTREKYRVENKKLRELLNQHKHDSYVQDYYCVPCNICQGLKALAIQEAECENDDHGISDCVPDQGDGEAG